MRKPPPINYANPRWTETESGCWEWGGTVTSHGYGDFIRGNGKGGLKHQAAHRWLYELLVGPIPEGLDLDHLCRNRRCVRPAHLEPVTRAENLRRGRGTKLTWEIVARIRAAEGSFRAIGRDFGVDHKSVAAIRRGETWVR